MEMQQLSSGDMLADRRADYARMMAEAGDMAGAADVMIQALERVPCWAAGWFQLSDYEARLGRAEAAAAALERVLMLDPGDTFGASLKLGLIGARQPPSHPSSLFVERLFDDYASGFDSALVERLEYHVPATLWAMIARQTNGARFAHVTDLGCGTGLMGERIRQSADFLEGFDLSSNMLARALAKGRYDRLRSCDLSLDPDRTGVFGEGLADARADLVTAADVFIYLGDLEPVFATVHRLISREGLFAFSIEDMADDGTGDRRAVLRPSLRYAHSHGHIEALCRRHGFAILTQETTTLRTDAGRPVSGLLFLVKRTG